MLKNSNFDKIYDHLFIFSTIILTVYSQIVIRWKVSSLGRFPEDINGKLSFLLNLFINPWIASSILATLFAGISWMFAISKFEIGYAYPWIALNFLLVMFLGWWLFDEIITIPRFLGTIIVVVGLIVVVRN